MLGVARIGPNKPAHCAVLCGEARITTGRPVPRTGAVAFWKWHRRL